MKVDSSTIVCAKLLRAGAVPRSELPELDYPEVRADVERRLREVGLSLATSAYSEYVGLRLISDVTGESSFDAASNLGLNADHCALLVVLWSYLNLQKRTAVETRESKGQKPLFEGDRIDAARKMAPTVRIETLAREFQNQFGSYSHVKSLIGTLRRLKFVAGTGDILEPGPLLELAIDGERMISFVQREPLADLLRRLNDRSVASQAPENEAEEKVLMAVRSFGAAGARIGEIEHDSVTPRTEVARILTNLRAQGKVEQLGTGYRTRYRALGEA